MGSVTLESHGLVVRDPSGETEPKIWGQVRIGSEDKTGTPVVSTSDSDMQSD